MLKKPPIWSEIGEIDGFIAIFYSSKMKWKSNFSKSLNSSNLSWFNWIVFWILHSKRLQKTCILQNCKKNHELHTLNMLWYEDCEFSTAFVVELNKHTCAKENEMSPCLSDVVFGQSFSLEIDLTHQQILIGFLFYIF